MHFWFNQLALEKAAAQPKWTLFIICIHHSISIGLHKYRWLQFNYFAKSRSVVVFGHVCVHHCFYGSWTFIHFIWYSKRAKGCRMCCVSKKCEILVCDSLVCFRRILKWFQHQAHILRTNYWNILCIAAASPFTWLSFELRCVFVHDLYNKGLLKCKVNKWIKEICRLHKRCDERNAPEKKRNTKETNLPIFFDFSYQKKVCMEWTITTNNSLTDRITETETHGILNRKCLQPKTKRARAK